MRKSLLSALLLVGLFILSVSVTPALAAPEWGLTLEHHNAYGAQRQACPGEHESLPGEPDCGVDPVTDSGTTFDRESGFNEYGIVVSNTGASATSGVVSVADQLPAGMTLAGTREEIAVSGQGWDCTITAGGSGVTCVREEIEELAPGAAFPSITLEVHVSPVAGDTSTNVVAVSGGGAETVSRDDPTTVASVPFGFHAFATSVTEALGDPFNQAAGHPFAASTEIVFDYVTADNGKLTTAGGGPKSVQVELPSGFVGNTVATPACPLKEFPACPTDTAVGYTQSTIDATGVIENGEAHPFLHLGPATSSLVFNLQPSPGYPAELGFVIAGGVPFVLDARVQSGGDYGVTIGDAAIANDKKLLATRLTFCENGATKVASPSLSYHCNPVVAGAPAFLTDPALCGSSAPTTAARATPWNEPGDEVVESVPTGLNLVSEQPSEAESFVTGCSNPELASAFGASTIGLSPETTQADSPSGASFDLKVPQTTEAGKLAAPELRSTTVVLPAGMSVSPSAASGLEACSEVQFGLGLHTEPAEPGTCPAGSQIGTVEVFTPLLSAEPTVEGVPNEGENMVCSAGTWNGNPTVTYQWLRGGVVIVGATNREYTVQAADKGEPLQCEVTATSHGGGSVAVSQSAVVAPEPTMAPAFLQTPLPAPAGTAASGSTLTCGAGMWSGNPTFAYRWLSGGVAITGAETSEYTLGSEDQGKAIQCQIIATNGSPSKVVIGDSPAVVILPTSLSRPPILAAPLQGKVFVGEPECSPCTTQDASEGHIFRLFLEVADPATGVLVKLVGHVSASPITGQLKATFSEQPQLPFSELRLDLEKGPRAPLVTPQICGEAQTTSDLTPWSNEPGIREAQGTPDATPSSAFTVDWNGAGEDCPSSIPFNPLFLAQTSSSTAGQYSPLSVSFARPAPAHEGEERDEQDFAGISVNTPPGLLGKIAGVERCPEEQANVGTCSSASAIGTTTVAAGTGSDPFYLGGTVYLTGPYKGAPFGLSIVVPAKAGPFTLAGTNGQGDVVVRAAIGVNPNTAALTVTSDPLPQVVDGVPLRLHSVRVDVNRPDFTLNPTSCAAQQITANIAGESVNSGEAGKTVSGSSQFAASNCAALPFNPSLSAQTQAKTSKADGASLMVVVAQKPGEANIAKVDVQLPKQLPARLTTLQKACLAETFASNPAACPAGSIVGMAVAHTPLLSSALTGPAILVSHGGAAFPDLELVLQGEGVTLILDGVTDIKKGITYSRFDTVPDAPISSFELNLPEGSDSVLATDIPVSAENNLCGSNLVMPTTITGQNGKQILQTTKITTGACTKVKTKILTRAQKLAKALKACRAKYKGKSEKSKRTKCETQARKKYGPLHKAKKAKKSSSRNGKAGR